MDVDRTPRVALQAGVEQALRVRQRGTVGEGQFHCLLVGFAGAQDAVVLPHRCTAPLPGFLHVRQRFMDQCTHACQRFAAPVPSAAMRASISSAAGVPASSGLGACVAIRDSRREGNGMPGLHALAGQRSGLAHPVQELRFIQQAGFVDVQVARVGAPGGLRWHRRQGSAAEKATLM